MFILMSSAIFGLLHIIRHGDYVHIMTYTVSGFIYSLVFTFTRDIKLPIILHMLNNIPVTLNKYGYEWITVAIMIMYFIVVSVAFYKVFTSIEFKQKLKEFRNFLMYRGYILRKKKATKHINLT